MLIQGSFIRTNECSEGLLLLKVPVKKRLQTKLSGKTLNKQSKNLLE